ncbi:MAG TPA: ABC transporter permease [Chthonomonadales bacterium]|nr:ABC transporter permease [Chthonomonadales bacterium]
MLTELREVWRYRELLWQLVRRNLKVRYKNSRLGFFWSIAPPLLEVLVITFAMKRATGFAEHFPSYSAFVIVAMIPWSYFQNAILDASQSILEMNGVIRKVYMPREIIPLAVAISNLIHFMLSWLVFFVYWWLVVGGPLLPTTVWFPFLVLVQFMLVTGLGLLVASLNVFYEDVKYIASILMRLGFFLLPIMYVAEQVQHRSSDLAFSIYMLNPLATLITAYRKVLLQSPTVEAIGGPSLPLDVAGMLITGAVSLAVLVGCYAFFNRRKWQFVERP